MNYVSLDQLLQDSKTLADKARRLYPRVAAVVGVPRSGLIPATVVAARLNVRMAEFGAFLRNPMEALGSAFLRESNPASSKSTEGDILVIDDSISNGVTFKNIRWMMQNWPITIRYLSVYTQSDLDPVDLFVRNVSQPRVFEWNWFRHSIMKRSLLDIDGVICEDWTGQEAKEPQKYKTHVTEAAPLFIPEREVLGLVTGRLESYYADTFVWLERAGVKYKTLTMYEAKTPEDRKKANNIAQFKANVYLTTEGAELFVESNDDLASDIYQQTGRPVLCPTTNRLYAG